MANQYHSCPQSISCTSPRICFVCEALVIITRPAGLHSLGYLILPLHSLLLEIAFINEDGHLLYKAAVKGLNRLCRVKAS